MKKWLITVAAFLTAVLVLGAGVMEVSAAEKIKTTSDGFSYKVSKDNTVEIIGYNGKKKNMKFPEKIKGKKVTRIGNGAGCNRYVNSITIPDTVTIVDLYAFWSCPNLTTITLGKNVKKFTTEDGYIGYEEYTDDDVSQYIEVGKKFKEFKVSKKNKVFSAKDGVLFKGKELVKCPPAKKGTYQVPKGTIVNLWAFDGSQLSTVKIPASVEYIVGFEAGVEGYVRSYDSGIAAYEVAKGNKNFYAKDGVLFGKNILPSYWNPKPEPGARLIHYPPEKRDASYRVPEDVRRVDECAFLEHKYLEEVEIPNADVDVSAFDGCVKLKRAVVSGYLSSYAFARCEELEEVEFVDAGDGRASGLGGFTFWGSGLRSLILSEAVAELSSDNVACYGLKWVEIRNKDCKFEETDVYDSGDISPVLSSKTIIYGYPGSTAEAYAREKGIEFRVIGEAKPENNPMTVPGATINLSPKTYTCDGEAKKPYVGVRDKSGNWINSIEYRVTYQNNKKPGLGVVKVKFKGYDYKGTIRTTFIIKPPKSTIKKLTPGKKSLTLQWGGVKSSWISGYEIQYSTDSAFEKGNTRNVNVKPNVAKKQIKKLKSGKTYYVRIRSYKTVQKDGKTEKLYSKWSGKKKVKTL